MTVSALVFSFSVGENLKTCSKLSFNEKFIIVSVQQIKALFMVSQTMTVSVLVCSFSVGENLKTCSKLSLPANLVCSLSVKRGLLVC